MRQRFEVTVSGFGAGTDVAEKIAKQVQAISPHWSVEVDPVGAPEEDEGSGALVSILLPNYNYGHRIERMIASIRAQSFTNYELIVVDDGSSDDSVSKIRPLLEPQDRLLLHGKNQGAAAAINTAAAMASGRFITWVSSDNEMTPDWLSRLLGEVRPDVGVVYANYDRFNDAGPQQGTWGKPYDPNGLISDENCFIGPAFLVRAEVWTETGKLRGKNSCDYDHWLRIEETCRRKGLQFVYLPNVLCHYYSGNERATVARRQDYDAPVWKAEARRRRGLEEAPPALDPKEFWDGVHEANVVHSLGETTALDYAQYFGQAGPFAEDLDKVQAVLDVGPGMAKFLKYLQSQNKTRLAIEISSLNREKLESMGVQAFAPGAIEEGVAELATCLSVVQHCDEAALEVLVRDVSRALQPGGRFYLNGVTGHLNATPENRLKLGQFSHRIGEVEKLLTEHGFQIVGGHDYAVKGHAALCAWVLCAEKSLV